MSDEIERLFRRERLLTTAASASCAAAVLCWVLQGIDPQTLLGESVWVKPTKFFVSFTVLLLTCAALLAGLRDRRRNGFLRWTLVFASVVEMACIVLQAARGERSHFNIATPFDETVYRIMAVAIAGVTLSLLAVLVRYFRPQPHLGPAVLISIRFAAGIFLLGCLATIPMLLSHSHSVGTEDGGPGLPGLGWSTVGGDLRVPHFLGIHALQVLPLLGLWLGRRLGRRSRRAGWLATAASVLYGLAVVGSWWAAMSGVPLVPESAP